MLHLKYCVHSLLKYVTKLIMFLCLHPDEDDEGERHTVPLAPLDSFFSDDDSLRQQKKKKPKKMKEGKMPKVKKRKKEVRCNSHSAPSVMTPDTKDWQVFWLRLFSTFSISQPITLLMSLQLDQRCILAAGLPL